MVNNYNSAAAFLITYLLLSPKLWCKPNFNSLTPVDSIVMIKPFKWIFLENKSFMNILRNFFKFYFCWFRFDYNTFLSTERYSFTVMNWVLTFGSVGIFFVVEMFLYESNTWCSSLWFTWQWFISNIFLSHLPRWWVYKIYTCHKKGNNIRHFY